jgi:hypothetical protein
MEGRFGLRYFPAQPSTQLVARLAGRFAFDSLALAKGFDPALKLGGSFGRLLQLFNRRLQLSQFLLDQFLDEQSLFWTCVLESDFVALTSCFSAAVHLSSSSFQQALVSLSTS